MDRRGGDGRLGLFAGHEAAGDRDRRAQAPQLRSARRLRAGRRGPDRDSPRHPRRPPSRAVARSRHPHRLLPGHLRTRVRHRHGAHPRPGGAVASSLSDRRLRAAGCRPAPVALAPGAAGPHPHRGPPRPRASPDALRAGRGPSIGIREDGTAQGSDRAPRGRTPCATERAATRRDGDRPRPRLPHGRDRRRGGGVRLSGDGAAHSLRHPEPRRTAPAGLDPDRRRHLYLRQLRGGHGVCVARPANSLPMTTAAAVARANPALAIGTVILGCVLALAVLAPLVAPYGVAEQSILDRLQSPGAKHLLGTDQYGRDLLTRTLFGGRTALLLGVGAVALGLLLGGPIGLASGYAGGRTDEVVMRVVDAFLSFPALLMALMIITALGASTAHALRSEERRV